MLVIACEPPHPERTRTVEPHLAAYEWRLPRAVVATYDVALDMWRFASTTERAQIDEAPPQAVAGPEALRHQLELHHWPRGTRVEIESRESLPDGFATTFLVHDDAAAVRPSHETFVIRELGNRWLRCVGALALCKSIKRGQARALQP